MKCPQDFPVISHLLVFFLPFSILSYLRFPNCFRPEFFHRNRFGC
jgi:hypothetical protein